MRDIWHDHVLYEGDEVSGLIDFGAMRAETVAADMSRLLGSLVGDHKAGWTAGLAAYMEVRPLEVYEEMLIAAFDRANVLLSGMTWLEWIYLDGRLFENREAVFERIDENIGRLANLVRD
jgi:homoserine kinase type II